ncbi:molybdenum cofactor guanylyltransferase [Heliobacterium chlorum]|uniref:Probable molybdenum cofactor guanylyltransferase n=1 Tax=Heliobacterium chlorum TaxID=2698 RepID=A0ABR7SZB5_HELCL|nr:molybdenum cofactor guanylyltransferase [Heliobacterium chlorum]MBC9783202.1 molybdenum cofactor guanylyltransferase [Heliobacterium chlorum]
MEATAIILSGGRNSRMGKNKAFMPVGGKAIIEQTIAELEPLMNDILVVTNEPEKYRYLGVPLIVDIFPGQGPLSGIHAGLTASRHHHNFIVACDMPFVDRHLVQAMLKMAPGYDVVVPQVGDYLQPLYAIYSKNCLLPIEQCLREDIRKVIAFYHKVRLRYASEKILGQWGDLEKIFYNINTPDDLSKAMKFCQERDRKGGS